MMRLKPFSHYEIKMVLMMEIKKNDFLTDEI
jgi:hypothetical protein